MNTLAAVMVTALAIATAFILASESHGIRPETAARRQRTGFAFAMLGLALAVTYAIASAAS